MVAPFERGTPLVRAFFQQADESLLLSGGLLAAKFAALNLLPIPPLPGGRVLTEIPPNRRNRWLWLWCNMLGVCVSFVIILCWLTALVNFWRLP